MPQSYKGTDARLMGASFSPPPTTPPCHKPQASHGVRHTLPWLMEEELGGVQEVA